jgi:hypothetical protein
MPYMIRISGRHSRDLTPRSPDDFLGFERAVAALLNREELVVQARQTRPTGRDLAHVTAYVRVNTHPDEAEPGANDTGAEVCWAGLLDSYKSVEHAQAMAAVMEMTARLAEAANVHIRTDWFKAHELSRATP